MKMFNPTEYYKKTMNNPPSSLIRLFFDKKYNLKVVGNTAIDLGCGAGNDTAFLLEKGYKVIAIDQEEQVGEIIKNRNLNKENLELIIADFTKIKIPMADLIFENFSLDFVKDNFSEFIKKVLKSIKQNGFFVGNFLGEEDDWKANGRTTVEKDELMNSFKDLKMFYFSEEKYYQDTASGKNKFWHVYTVIAQKNK